MKSEAEFIESIKKHTLGDPEEAQELYHSFCNFLKEKYGLVDRDYDEKPTKRGNEWLDIHHIREDELDDIATRTDIARDFERRKLNKQEDHVLVALKSSDWNHKKMEEIRNQYSGKSVAFLGIDYSLQELKPYNVKEQLVYANKIEHFLLHYLLASMFGQNVFCGGVNYLWDNVVALDLYGTDAKHKNKIKENKKYYYSYMTSEEATLLYKKLIDWKKWNIKECKRYWNEYNAAIRNLDEKRASYVEDKAKFFHLLSVLNFKLDKETEQKINSLPFKYPTIILKNGETAIVKDRCLCRADGKTAILFRISLDSKSFTIPWYIESIEEAAFPMVPYYNIEQITVPLTVKQIDDTAFLRIVKSRSAAGENNAGTLKIKYNGTREMWNERFSNVKLDGITLACCRRVHET